MNSMTVIYGRDLRGRLAALGTVESPSRFATYDYWADGSVASEQLGAGVRRIVRDSLGRLARLVDPAFSQDLSYRTGESPSHPFGDGRIMAEATSWQALPFGSGAAPADTRATYDYDRFGRLETVTADRPAVAASFASDANSNLLRRSVGDEATRSYLYRTATDRLAQVVSSAGSELLLTHDGNGAVSLLGSTTLRHDGPGDRPSCMRTPHNTLACQRNSAGERVLKRVTGEDALVRLTVRSGSRTLMELARNGEREFHIHGPAGLVALLIDGTDHAVSRDQRGSIRAVWNGREVVVQFDYLALGDLDTGNSRSAGSLAHRIRRRYTGQEWDAETSLYDFHARAFDPALGRFLSTDPAGDGDSPYAYVSGDPVDFADPSGETKFIANIFRFDIPKSRMRMWIFTDAAEKPIMSITSSRSRGRLFGEFVRGLQERNALIAELDEDEFRIGWDSNVLGAFGRASFKRLLHRAGPPASFRNVSRTILSRKAASIAGILDAKEIRSDVTFFSTEPKFRGTFANKTRLSPQEFQATYEWEQLMDEIYRSDAINHAEMHRGSRTIPKYLRTFTESYPKISRQLMSKHAVGAVYRAKLPIDGAASKVEIEAASYRKEPRSNIRHDLGFLLLLPNPASYYHE